MRSVADTMRAELEERVRALSPKRRLELAFEMGQNDLALLQAAQNLDREAALRLLRRQRQAGRRPSSCMQEPEG